MVWVLKPARINKSLWHWKERRIYFWCDRLFNIYSIRNLRQENLTARLKIVAGQLIYRNPIFFLPQNNPVNGCLPCLNMFCESEFLCHETFKTANNVCLFGNFIYYIFYYQRNAFASLIEAQSFWLLFLFLVGQFRNPLKYSNLSFFIISLLNEQNQLSKISFFWNLKFSRKTSRASEYQLGFDTAWNVDFKISKSKKWGLNQSLPNFGDLFRTSIETGKLLCPLVRISFFFFMQSYYTLMAIPYAKCSAWSS